MCMLWPCLQILWAGIALIRTSCMLNTTAWKTDEVGVQFPAGVRDFSPLQTSHIPLEDFYPKGTDSPSPVLIPVWYVHEADSFFHLVPGLICFHLYLHSPRQLHSVNLCLLFIKWSIRRWSMKMRWERHVAHTMDIRMKL